MATLIIQAEDGSERAVELTERTLQIGRGAGNDIVLPDARSGVSRTHAELRFRNGRWVVVDLQSQNGTWLNGDRVEHAEVPAGAEIVLGSYRLRLQAGAAGLDPAAGRDRATAATATLGTAEPAADAQRRDLRGNRLTAAPRDPGVMSDGSRVLMVGGGAAALVTLVVVGWLLVLGQDADSSGSAEREPVLAPDSAPAETVAAAALPDPSPAPAPTAAPATVTLPPARPTPVVRPAAEASPVARRPGESVEAWRTRTAAFQTRYAYSRAALERGDFAAAASGFEAILREEPGFLDVPELLVRARGGLRDAARGVFVAGQRLDAAGDWIGALHRYEQARQIHPDVPGLADATRQVRARLKSAGATAFARARELEASGRHAEALREYDKALQWLPPEDPTWRIAQSRAEVLRRAPPGGPR